MWGGIIDVTPTSSYLLRRGLLTSCQVLSTYPPGYGGHWEGKPGPRMCGASFSSSPVEARIIRIGASMVSAQVSNGGVDNHGVDEVNGGKLLMASA